MQRQSFPTLYLISAAELVVRSARCATSARIVVAGLLVAVLLSAGCGRKEAPRLKSWPAHGKLMVNDQPADHAEITLHPKTPLEDTAGHRFFPHATVSADGTFVVETYENGDGAPAGEYIATITWPQLTVDGGEENIGPDRLRNTFNSIHTPAATVVIEEHDNDIPPIALNYPQLIKKTP